MNAADHVELFRAYPVIQGLPRPLLETLEDVAAPVQVPAGEQLFGDGSPCVNYPLLVAGIIRVSRPSASGQGILLYRLAPGESCAITVLTLLGGGGYPAVGIAETTLSLFSVPKNVFLQMVLEFPPFRQFVFSAISGRMAQLMALVEEVAFYPINQRLAARLLDHADPFIGTHQELADELGTTREAVSRTLETFQESGLIRLGRKRIEILERSGLVRLQRVEGRGSPAV